MSLVSLLLETSERTWREVIKTEDPLFLDTPVIIADPDPTNARHWMFYTSPETTPEGKKRWTTHMDVFKPQLIEQLFADVIAPMYEQAYGEQVPNLGDLISRLIHDNFFYLYSHEQFHPKFCPDSKEDEKAFDLALYNGIKRALPSSKKADILHKVGNVRNAGWDQVIDGGFYSLINHGNRLERRLETVLAKAPVELTNIPHLPDAVIPIFDILEFHLQDKKFDSLFYPISRAIYGLLFTREAQMREPVFEYFRDRITTQMPEREFDGAMRSALKGFVANLSREQLRFARIDPQEFNAAVDEMYDHYNDPLYDSTHRKVVTDITSLLIDKRSRYEAIGGFIEPLAKYISLSKEEKRHGSHIGEGGGEGQGEGKPGQGEGEGQPGQGQGSSSDDQTGQNAPGGNTEQALVNLADVLDDGEAKDLLSSVANSPGSSQGGSQGGAAQKNKRLSNLARDEFYKRNTPEISIKSPDYEAVQISLGKKFVHDHIGSQLLTPMEVGLLDLEQILRFQDETGLQVLTQLSEHQFRLDHYETIEIEETDYAFENSGIDLPANVVFHVDSSMSMGKPAYVNTGCNYDVLMNVCFGLLKTLKDASKKMKSQVFVIAANFSNGTILSDAVELNHMYDTPNNSAKKALLGFQNGGTHYSETTMDGINTKLKPGKTVHIWVGDGDLNQGCKNSAYEQIEEVANMPDTSFLYFEIGSSSSFGQRVKKLAEQKDNVQCYLNTTLASVQNNSLEILVQYS
jgi:hypothetical protein